MSSKKKFLKSNELLNLMEPINIEPIVPPPPRRSSRISYPLERYLAMLKEDIKKIFFVGDKDHRDDLKTYDEAMADIDFEKWLNAMKSEID